MLLGEQLIIRLLKLALEHFDFVLVVILELGYSFLLPRAVDLVHFKEHLLDTVFAEVIML